MITFIRKANRRATLKAMLAYFARVLLVPNINNREKKHLNKKINWKVKSSQKSATMERWVSNCPIQFESARKICFLLELLAKLDAPAREIFATARMLKFSLQFSAVWRKHNLHLGNKN